MTYNKLRKKQVEYKDINQPGGSLDPRFRGVKFDVPAKVVSNTKSDMDLLRLYTHGHLKFKDTGKTCGNCVWYYPDPNLGPHKGRCKFYGFKQVHEDLAADEVANYTEPEGKFTFPMWPGCPTFTKMERLSRR